MTVDEVSIMKKESFRVDIYLEVYCLQNSKQFKSRTVFSAVTLAHSNQLWHILIWLEIAWEQKQPSRAVLTKACSENMKQIYRRTPMPKCDFNKVTLISIIEIVLHHGCSHVNLLHIFRAPFCKNTSARLFCQNKICYTCELK